MKRSRQYRRQQRKNTIRRKKRILIATGLYHDKIKEGYLDKGKIHCSCWMCRPQEDKPKYQVALNRRRY